MGRRPDRRLSSWGAANSLSFKNNKDSFAWIAWECFSLGKSNAGRYRVSLEGADILNFLCWPSLQVTPTAQPWSAPLENEMLDWMTRTMITHAQPHWAFITFWCQGRRLHLIAQMKQLAWELKNHMTCKWYNQAHWLQVWILFQQDLLKIRHYLSRLSLPPCQDKARVKMCVDKKRMK